MRDRYDSGQSNRRNQSDDRRYSNNRDNNYYSRQRSRDKNNNRDRWNQGNQRGNNNWRNDNNYGRYDRTNQIRKVHPTKVEDPKQFIISFNPQLGEKPFKKFIVKVEDSTQIPEPLPSKKQSRVDQLKDKITPVEKIWSSHIKQYLNDSQFVEIHRKGKSLAFGPIQYGKTMINYDEGDKSMHYENKTSQSRIFSRAYFKIWEILALGIFQGKQKQSLQIASVAQGPGGFIHAMIDFRLKHAEEVKDDFYSITLKIDNNTRNAKDWSDFRGEKHFKLMRDVGYKIQLSYGQTGNGDLLKPENIDYFAKKDLKDKKCYLVTGDGGIECIGDKQFDYQQVFNVKLFLGEIITALKIQAIGGKFILKVYDSSFGLTRQLMMLLAVYYKKVRMIKPVTSRPGNSQKYMLCEDFIGISEQQYEELKKLLVKWTEIEPDLSYFENKNYVKSILQFPQLQNKKQIWENLQTCNKYFLEEQAEKLDEGLKLIQQNEGDQYRIQDLLKKKRFQEQMSYAYQWCRRYGLSSISVEMQDKNNSEKNN